MGAMEEVVEIGTTIKEDTMATVDMVEQIIGVEEVDIRRRVVEERGGTMVGTTTAGTNGWVRQEVIDLRREATLMMGMKKGKVTTEDQETRGAMSGRRVSLAQRRITLETLKMPKVRHVDVVSKLKAPDLSLVLLRGSAPPEQLNVIWRCLTYEFGIIN